MYSERALADNVRVRAATTPAGKFAQLMSRAAAAAMVP